MNLNEFVGAVLRNPLNKEQLAVMEKFMTEKNPETLSIKCLGEFLVQQAEESQKKYDQLEPETFTIRESMLADKRKYGVEGAYMVKEWKPEALKELKSKMGSAQAWWYFDHAGDKLLSDINRGVTKLPHTIELKDKLGNVILPEEYYKYQKHQKDMVFHKHTGASMGTASYKGF